MLNTQSVQQALANIACPDVVDFQIRLGEDWSGDPAVFVWVILTGDEVPFARQHELTERVTEAVRGLPGGEAVWTYVYFRTAEEDAELAREAAEEERAG